MSGPEPLRPQPWGAERRLRDDPLFQFTMGIFCGVWIGVACTLWALL